MVHILILFLLHNTALVSLLFGTTSYDIVFTLVSLVFPYTVEPPKTDPPTSGPPLYNGHWLWHGLKLQ